MGTCYYNHNIKILRGLSIISIMSLSFGKAIYDLLINIEGSCANFKYVHYILNVLLSLGSIFECFGALDLMDDLYCTLGSEMKVQCIAAVS